MKRAVLFLLAAAFPVGVGIAVVSLRGDSAPEDGPISGPLGSTIAQRAEVGQLISVGNVNLRNDGSKPAVVERVRLLGASGPLELLGFRTRLLPADGHFVNAGGFPPARYQSEPLSEKSVVPVYDPEKSNELHLVIGVRATEPGVARFRAVEVTYQVGKHQYREVFRNSYYLCAPTAEYTAEDGSGNCPPPEIEDRFDDRVLG